MAHIELTTTDTQLLDAFERTTLPFDHWTHQAHVRVGYLFLRQFPFPEALGRVRHAIQTYNRAYGVPTTPTSGYHETITVAFMSLVAAALMESGDPGNSKAFLEQHAHLLDKRILRQYYSRELLCSPAASQTYVGPDLQELPG